MRRRRQDISLTIALSVSLIAHGGLAIWAVRSYGRDGLQALQRFARWTYADDKAELEKQLAAERRIYPEETPPSPVYVPQPVPPPVELRPTPPPDPTIGDAVGGGQSNERSPGDEPMQAHQAPEDQPDSGLSPQGARRSGSGGSGAPGGGAPKRGADGMLKKAAQPQAPAEPAVGVPEDPTPAVPQPKRHPKPIPDAAPAEKPTPSQGKSKAPEPKPAPTPAPDTTGKAKPPDKDRPAAEKDDDKDTRAQKPVPADPHQSGSTSPPPRAQQDEHSPTRSPSASPAPTSPKDPQSDTDGKAPDAKPDPKPDPAKPADAPQPADAPKPATPAAPAKPPEAKPAPAPSPDGAAAGSPSPEAPEKSARPSPNNGSGTPGQPAKPGDPSPQSDSESDPFSKRASLTFRNGRVEAAFGRKIKAVRPRFSVTGEIDAGLVGAGVTLAVSTDASGKVIKVEVLESSGAPDTVDLPIVRAVYAWWIEPPKDKTGANIPDTLVWRIELRS